MFENTEVTISFQHNDEVVTLKLPDQHFSIDPSEIDSELCSIGPLMLRYGELEARLQAEVETLEAQFKKWEADKDLEIRNRAKEIGEKITEGGVSARIQSDPTRLARLTEIAESRRNFLTARSAHNSLRSKRDCLIALAYRDKELIKADRYSS